ncbi:pyridoxamine 5'-phosphate oxidase family protein [Crenobacter sp. SG2305]|uniref:HugZ family pyridoxamine 5'-phosphate oxidase n=1 Tax=Crenobacter oryzisoli TaxID=3056844 RepID=UPI0025AA6335|nr:pyridoxamine 5'-phosphate oxidase family protein [Crenobacter sp. SG2305]MDN0085152.1 pyridoxamine 5'-phosphate oxidase family protein [Crenobacter sp. SG2305]
MKIPPSHVIDLLHTAAHGALASHSLHLPGYPFATLLPFVPDAQHRPLFLISRLAEHTRNLAADPRASLLVAEPHATDVLSSARLTVVGEVQPVGADAIMTERYLRYYPEAADYLALGDFAFYRLEPLAWRLIAGFGRMGWIEDNELGQAEVLMPEQEAMELSSLALRFPGARWLGLDAYGADLEYRGQRQRLSFPAPAANAEARQQAVAEALVTGLDAHAAQGPRE